jgi:hypothetical protein
LNHRIIESFAIAIGDWRLSVSSFQFPVSPSANWFILSPETVDSRSGEVWAAGLMVSVRRRPPFEISNLRFSIFAPGNLVHLLN